MVKFVGEIVVIVVFILGAVKALHWLSTRNTTYIINSPNKDSKEDGSESTK